MGGPITLRPCQADDEPFLYRVYASTRADELALLDWDDAQKEAFVRMQFTAQHSYYHEQFPDAAYDVILRDGQPIGRLYVDRRPDEILILDIALLTEQRRAGIGRALLREVLAEAARAGKPVRIHVEINNPAMSLYQRLGFAEIRIDGFHVLMEWTSRALPASAANDP